MLSQWREWWSINSGAVARGEATQWEKGSRDRYSHDYQEIKKASESQRHNKMKPHGVFGGREGSGAESGSPASPVAEGLLYTVFICTP